MKDLPHTALEQLRHMAENPGVNKNWLMFLAHDAGIDIDNKYDESFGRAERAIADEWNLETN